MTPRAALTTPTPVQYSRLEAVTGSTSWSRGPCERGRPWCAGIGRSRSSCSPSYSSLVPPGLARSVVGFYITSQERCQPLRGGRPVSEPPAAAPSRPEHDHEQQDQQHHG